MQKTISVLVGILILLLFSEGLPEGVNAGPPPLMPSSFYGAAKEKGANVPDGTVITAWIKAVAYAETFSFLYEGNSVYTLDVPADDPSTPGIVEGGIEGDTILFKIGGLETDQTDIWLGGTNRELNLSVSIAVSRTYLPLILN